MEIYAKLYQDYLRNYVLKRDNQDTEENLGRITLEEAAKYVRSKGWSVRSYNLSSKQNDPENTVYLKKELVESYEYGELVKLNQGNEFISGSLECLLGGLLFENMNYLVQKGWEPQCANGSGGYLMRKKTWLEQ